MLGSSAARNVLLVAERSSFHAEDVVKACSQPRLVDAPADLNGAASALLVWVLRAKDRGADILLLKRLAIEER